MTTARSCYNVGTDGINLLYESRQIFDCDGAWRTQYPSETDRIGTGSDVDGGTIFRFPAEESTRLPARFNNQKMLLGDVRNLDHTITQKSSSELNGV